ncbi:MAG TPA: TIGR03560 family F420-dependent LLM class oxidoreductase [Candidatus Binataceae bacterium]|nr:TIGR03560 family F420-dependent LLM class oxidoreductase [Candidatus Binataceae bacterium]
MKLALNLPQFMDYRSVLDRTLLAERLGYHSVWLQDHMWQLRTPEFDHPEAIATMAALAARTSRIRIGNLVLCNSYRNPALLAKTLSTIDDISGGRLEIGIGAGWFRREYEAYGYEFPATGVRLAQLEEALQIINLLFTEPSPSFHGRYYRIDRAYNFPKPMQKPRPPITIGGKGEKVLLRLVARYADRWNAVVSGAEEFDHKLRVLKEHCAALGRDPNTLEISEQVLVFLGAAESNVRRVWEQAGRHPLVAEMREVSAIKGTPAAVAEQLREHERRGVQMLILWFADYGRPETIDLFAREVMPALQ